MFEILIGRCPELQANIGRFIFQLEADIFYPMGYKLWIFFIHNSGYLKIPKIFSIRLSAYNRLIST